MTEKNIVHRTFHFRCFRDGKELPFDITQIVETSYDYSMQENAIDDEELEILQDLIDNEQTDEAEFIVAEVRHKFESLGWSVIMSE
jgi:hypothetical protein